MSNPTILESRIKRDSDHAEILSNDLDDLFNAQDASEEEDEDEDDDNEEVALAEDGDSSLTTAEMQEKGEENHWLVRSVKRIRRSIDGIFGSPASKLDDDVEKHVKKMHGRKGKGKKGKKQQNKSKLEGASRKIKKEQKRRDKQEKKSRNNKAHEVHHQPISRVRRQHVISHDDEDLADGSGSDGSFDVTNRQCK